MCVVISLKKVVFYPRGLFLCLLAAALPFCGRADIPATNEPAASPLVPSADESRIARVTAQLLERFQYQRQTFNNEVSSNFLVQLTKTLDPQHIHFLQSDLKEFSRYQNALDDLTLKYGDTTPGYEIFNRFRQRLEERVTYSKELLANEKFSFTNDERIIINRKDEPYPKDLAEAKQLWRDRVRFDYLQEKLNQPATNTLNIAATNSAAGGTTNAAPRTPEQVHEEIVKTLNRRYERIAKVFRDWDSDNVVQFYLDTLAHVYDPHSDYMGKAAAEDFAIGMNLSLFGIGALLTSEDGYCKIKELKPGPAAKDGRLKPGDRIVAVAQGTNEPVDVVDMPLNKAVQLIRGPKDSEVRLTVWPASATDSATRKVISLVRDEIKLEDGEAKAKLIYLPDGQGHTNRIGVIDLPSFYATIDNPGTPDANEKAVPRSTTDDVAKLIKKLEAENVSGIILDLRRNGGGSLEEAVNLTGLFIRRGPVVQVRDPSGIVMSNDDDDPDELYDGPLVVLTSRFSASASEIVAGALQDYGRALIVGDSSTHGKGTVQSLMPLLRIPGAFPPREYSSTNNPGELKITIRKFYRPSGRSTQLKGVTPDVVLPSVNNLAEVGESSLDNPLPWDTIQASIYKPVDLVAPYLAELRKRSAARLSTNKDFAYIREDMELYKKVQDDKTVSLNEEQRLKEKQENEARIKARKQERATRPPNIETVYEISLKQAGLPGLPPPMTNTNSAKTNLTSISGVNTNAPETNATNGNDLAKSPHSDDLDDEADDDSNPTQDAHLEEASRILLDLINLSPREAIAATSATKQVEPQ